MSAHHVRRVVGVTVLVLLAPLLALVLPAPANAVHRTVTANLDGTTTQVGRIYRDGVASTCGTAKAFPGDAGSASTFSYTTRTFVAATSGCLTITRSNVTCAAPSNLHLAVYLADYHPNAREAHYVGDQGSSDDAKVIGIDVVKGQTYVVAAFNTNSQESCSADVTFDLADDSTPPDTAFLRTPPAKVRDSSISLGFTGNPVADTAGFQCQVDGAAFAACSSPLQLDGLAVGSHTVAVRAVDEFGNVDATPAVATFLSCDLTGAAIALENATTARDQAGKAVAKAKTKLQKAKTPKARKKARQQLAKASKAAKAARQQVATIRQGVSACAQ